MLTRNTVLSFLTGAFLALLIVGGFLALDRTSLHWYAEEDVPDALSATAAEAYAISYMNYEEESYAAFLNDHWLPDCKAEDRSKGGWLVSCGLSDVLDTGASLPQILTYLVTDDGAVSSFP